MISVIVCSRSDLTLDAHYRNVKRTVGVEFEYIRLDGSAGSRGICNAYNEGVASAKGDILVFAHDDVFVTAPGWGEILASKFSRDPSLGLIGVAGTQHLFNGREIWTAAGMPYLRGRVLHALDNSRQSFLTVFSSETRDDEVVAVDGLFFAVPRSMFDRVRFDEETFEKFHFHDMDICMQIRQTHKLIVTCDILVKHLSVCHTNAAWFEAAERFLLKYHDLLPVSCANRPPRAPRRGPRCFSVDVRGPLPRSRV